MNDRELGSIDRADVLIVRGVESTDELATLGLPFAERYQAASSVVLVDSGVGREVKGRTITGSIQFVDADPRAGRIGRVLARVYDEYQRAHPSLAHVAHCIVGKFIFFCFLERDGRPVSVMDLIGAGDVEAIEVVAEHFIFTRFEGFYAQSGISDVDASRRDAACAGLNAQTDADLGVDGGGEDVRADRA